MRARNAWLALSLLATGCAHSDAPAHWLPRAVEAQTETHGGWVLVHLKDKHVHRGELLAVDADSVFVLEDSTCVALSSAAIARAVVTGYDSGAGTLAAWTTLGAVSSLSHGYAAAITLPTWLIVGGTVTSLQSHAGRVDVATWERARMYARFPQGLPPGLDRAALRAKP